MEKMMLLVCHVVFFVGLSPLTRNRNSYFDKDTNTTPIPQVSNHFPRIRTETPVFLFLHHSQDSSGLIHFPPRKTSGLVGHPTVDSVLQGTADLLPYMIGQFRASQDIEPGHIVIVHAELFPLRTESKLKSFRHVLDFHGPKRTYKPHDQSLVEQWKGYTD